MADQEEIDEMSLDYRSGDRELKSVIRLFNDKLNELTGFSNVHSHTVETLANSAIESVADKDVLTWDATRKKWVNSPVNITVKCRAYLNANQLNIVSGSWTKVNLNAETYDIGGNFDTANYKFVAPKAGYYLIAAALGWTAILSGAVWTTAIYVNGAMKCTIGIHSSNTNDLRVGVVDIISLAETEYVELYAYQNSGNNTPDLKGLETHTWMSIHLLSI